MICFILCEGKTDAILLSYYLERMNGWKYDRKPKYFNLNFLPDDNRYVGHYKRGNQHLSICAVGGRDNFINFYKENIESYIQTAESLESEYKLAIVVDRDDRTTEEIEKDFSNKLYPCINNVINKAWTKSVFNNKFGQETMIQVLCLVIPCDKQGALETLLMDALSEDTYKENLINKSKKFVDEISSEASKIISSERLKLKTKLGVSLAILYPEKIFSLIDEQLKSIPWEKSEILAESFEQLLEM